MAARKEMALSVFSWFWIPDILASCVAEIANLYHVSFWKLWDQLPEVTRQDDGSTLVFGSDGVPTVSTDVYLKCMGDDRLPYWQENSDVSFSHGMQNWMKRLQEDHTKLLNDEVSSGMALRDFLTVMKHLTDKYKVYLFTDFFEASLENIHNRRLQMLWLMLARMTDRQTEGLAEESRMYFGTYYPEGIYYSMWEPNNEDKQDWRFARMLLMRFAGLLGNNKLRYKLFGV